jgi:hypothetical protein
MAWSRAPPSDRRSKAYIPPPTARGDGAPMTWPSPTTEVSVTGAAYSTPLYATRGPDGSVRGVTGAVRGSSVSTVVVARSGSPASAAVRATCRKNSSPWAGIREV